MSSTIRPFDYIRQATCHPPLDLSNNRFQLSVRPLFAMLKQNITSFPLYGVKILLIAVLLIRDPRKL